MNTTQDRLNDGGSILHHLAIPNIETVESEDTFGRFKVEPLEKGVGITLGNALRRILLGYLTGAAVTRVKIEGIQHEFSTIPYMKEDTMEFLLNVKALRLKALSGRPGKLRLEMEGEGQVYGADIKASDDFEIANPELYLATLDSPEARLYVEFDVDMGEGIRETDSSDNLPVGAIPVDAIFTPIRKANFTIEPMHVGRETRYERLYLEVWTDGTISPVDSISQSAEMLTEMLSPFVDYARISKMGVGEELVRQAAPDERYSITIGELDLSVRTLNALRRAGIATVGELVAKEGKELLSLRNFGQKSKEEVAERLGSLGLSLASQEEPQETVESEAGNETEE